ncbi:MAG: hypothetical protein PT957_02485 [Firmicutes bacterium]|nr:hypothetical protein [Bacillota bacterium]
MLVEMICSKFPEDVGVGPDKFLVKFCRMKVILQIFPPTFSIFGRIGRQFFQLVDIHIGSVRLDGIDCFRFIIFCDDVWNYLIAGIRKITINRSPVGLKATFNKSCKGVRLEKIGINTEEEGKKENDPGLFLPKMLLDFEDKHAFSLIVKEAS